MYRILFIANNPTALSGMLFLIEKIKEEYDIIPVLMCENCCYETVEFEVINLTPDYVESEIHHSIKNYYNKDKKRVLYQVLNFVSNLRIMRRDDKISKKFLKNNRIDGIVIYCDRMGGILQGFIKNKGRIPVILVPIAESSVESLFEPRQYNLEVRISKNKFDINKIAKIINPKWAYSINGEEVLFYSLGRCLAGYLCNMVSLNPWIKGGGGSTHVFVESKSEAEAILEVCSKQVMVTGLCEDFYISETNKNKEQVRHNLEEKYEIYVDNLVVLSMPQIAEHGMVPWEIHRKNMAEVVRNMTDVYGRFLISLHPKSCMEDYLFLHKYGNFQIIEERLRDVVSGIDILVAADTSSVHRFTYILGKKSIKINTSWLMVELDEKRLMKIKKAMEKSLCQNVDMAEREIDIKCVPREIMKIIKQENG